MDLTRLSEAELIALRVEIEKEIHSRGLSLTVGEVGEALAIRHFNTTPGLSNLKAAQPGTKNVDALSRNGDRYSIKTVQKAKKTGTIYPDSQSHDRQLFEFLLIVILAEDFSLKELYLFNWQQFLLIRAWDKRMNAWYVPVSKKRLVQGQCIYKRDSIII